MPPDAARYARMSDPDENPAFHRLWEETEPAAPRPLHATVPLGRAMHLTMRKASEERLKRQIKEVFGE